MYSIRKSADRGHAQHGWLDARHSFSFANYYDPMHMGFGPLIVINEDQIAAGKGFGTHGHRDMEIITYVLSGELAHRDSMGNGSSLKYGDVQRMSAGTGVMHSEFNASSEHPLHLLQIWIHPEQSGIAPGYEEAHFDAASKSGTLRLIVSRDGRHGSLRMHQDADLYASILAPDQAIQLDAPYGRLLYLHLIRGSARINGVQLDSGDAIKLTGENQVTIESLEESEFLLFDLPEKSYR